MSTWTRTLSSVPGRPDARILCLPYAGGTASAYRSWASVLPVNVQLQAVELPGHGLRLAEEPLRRSGDVIRPLADELAREHRLLPSPRTILFGHSMGALLAYELCRALCERGMPPAALVVSAMCPADRLDRKANGLLAERRNLLLDHIRQLGQTPPEVLESPTMRDLVLRPAQADFELLAHAPAPAPVPLDVPVLALAGRHDFIQPSHLVGAWERHTRQWLGMRVLHGDHFFPWQSEDVGYLLNELARTAAVPAAAAR
ncbi:thioesterase II family protein [Streptomyces roseicoloratus]|uniref:Alpha/beta fold hydrolase n=1 Tax=Streptomyces roseicoloratus TaxID=2508722 RepID=A0ABY9RR67_9ACTN|nr:alpha/beta fold hydrolase [Streptomyces roseicoloratus]WMX44194.1 alpha/beta fold hydrolase [Streptomyces roseicoloratus]